MFLLIKTAYVLPAFTFLPALSSVARGGGGGYSPPHSQQTLTRESTWFSGGKVVKLVFRS